MKTRGSNYRLKYYDFWFLGKKYIGCNLSLGQFSWGAVFLGVICPRGNYVDDKSSERQFFLGAILREILSGGNYLWSHCLKAIIRGQSSRGQLSRDNTLQISDSCYEKKITRNEQVIAHFEYFFTCHYSKTLWLFENLNEINITYYEKIFSHIKQKIFHFEKGLGNVLTEKTFFCLTEINIIFTEIQHIKTNPKNNYQNI